MITSTESTVEFATIDHMESASWSIAHSYDAARRIAPKLDIQANRSHSFQVFVRGVEALLA